MANFRTAYDETPFKVQVHFVDEFGEPEKGMTEQNHKASTDINNIIKQYDKTGVLTHVNESKAHYGDYTLVNEYQENLNLVIKAQNSFNELPSEVRKVFGNDPGAFIEFVTNPDNHPELVEMGLAKPKPPVEPVVEAPTPTAVATPEQLPT